MRTDVDIMRRKERKYSGKLRVRVGLKIFD